MALGSTFLQNSNHRKIDDRGRKREAQKLYQETAQSIEKREKMALARKMNYLSMPHPDRRPNKKERRDLIKFKHSERE